MQNKQMWSCYSCLRCYSCRSGQTMLSSMGLTPRFLHPSHLLPISQDSWEPLQRLRLAQPLVPRNAFGNVKGLRHSKPSYRSHDILVTWQSEGTHVAESNKAFWGMNDKNRTQTDWYKKPVIELVKSLSLE